MTEVKFSCPACDQHIACDAAMAGLRVDCPECGAVMRVPLLGVGPKENIVGRPFTKLATHYPLPVQRETLREIPVWIYVLAAIALLPIAALTILFIGCTGGCG